MEINTQEYQLKMAVVTLRGRVEISEIPALRKLCDDYLESGVTHFVFDLSEITMLDSAGLAVLVSVLKRARAKDGDARLVLPKSNAAVQILKLTKFDEVFMTTELSRIIPASG
ncbi:MAG: STAS domain-containing protein [Anaerolineales bacterium]